MANQGTLHESVGSNDSSSMPPPRTVAIGTSAASKTPKWMYPKDPLLLSNDQIRVENNLVVLENRLHDLLLGQQALAKQIATIWSKQAKPTVSRAAAPTASRKLGEDEVNVDLLENKILRRIMSDYIKAGKQILKTKSKNSPAMSQKWRDFIVEKLGAEEDDEERSKGQLIIKLKNMSEVDLVSLFVSLCKGKVSNPMSAILKNPDWEPALKDQMTAFSGSEINPKGGLEFRKYITDALGLDEDAPPGEEENPLITAINDLTNKDMDNLYEMIRPKKTRQGKKPSAA